MHNPSFSIGSAPNGGGAANVFLLPVVPFGARGIIIKEFAFELLNSIFNKLIHDVHYFPRGRTYRPKVCRNSFVRRNSF